MDTERFERVARLVGTMPSRRAISRALVGLAAGSIFDPLLDAASVDAGGKKGKKKRKKKKDKKPDPPRCPSGRTFCQADGKCCQDTLCHATCGCCPETAPKCCSGTNNHFCYDPSKEECCGQAEAGIAGTCPKGKICGPKLGGLVFCCPSGGEICGDGCCEQGSFCCGDGICCDNYACQPAPEGSCWPGPLGTSGRYQ
jgi:hypothetical protein